MTPHAAAATPCVALLLRYPYYRQCEPPQKSPRLLAPRAIGQHAQPFEERARHLRLRTEQGTQRQVMEGAPAAASRHRAAT